MTIEIDGDVAIDIALALAKDLTLNSVKFGAIKASLLPRTTFTTGDEADQANLAFAEQRIIGATSNDDLDLFGSLKDPFGDIINFARIRVMYIKAASANTGTIQIGNAAGNVFDSWVGASDDSIILNPGGAFMLLSPDATGYTVGNGASDLLRIRNNGASSGTYDIVLVGADA